MFQNTEDMVWNTQNVYTSPTSSVEKANSTNSSSQDSFSSAMSEKVPSPDSTNTPGKPYLKIIEEPANQFRFRYKSEMQGTHGAILGVRATKGEKTYPTVQLFNYEGDAVIRCTLYTAENKRRRPHVHRLVGKLSAKSEKDDPHDLPISQRVNHTACFQNLVIIHTAKKVLVDELLGKKIRIEEARFTKKLRIEESLLGKMRLEAEQDAKGMNMNSVSLKFEAFTSINQQYIPLCEPVYSQPIYNMKSHETGQLRICRLSKFYSSCEGGEEILLFVEKVGKNNIKVLFTELDDYGNEIWRDYATHVDVHHQFGISCRCPKYKSQDISREVLVKMQLERPSDGAKSETRDFVYKPGEYSNTATKRRRLDSAAFSPQIPDSTFKAQINTFETVRPTESCAATSSIVQQSSNADPLLEIREPLQQEDDFVLFKDTFFSSQIQDELMHGNTNEENASSSISFSAEIGKIPTPPESMIPSVFSSEELQKAFQEDAIAPDHGELVPDRVYTRNLKPRDEVETNRATTIFESYLNDILSSLAEPEGPEVVMSSASTFNPAAMLEFAFNFAREAMSPPKIRMQMDPRPTTHKPDEVHHQLGLFAMRPMSTHGSMTEVFLSLVTDGIEFLQSILASTQKLISRIKRAKSTTSSTHNSDSGTIEDFLNQVFTDGVQTLQSAVEMMQLIIIMVQGSIPTMQAMFSSNFNPDEFFKSIFEEISNGLDELLNKKKIPPAKHAEYSKLSEQLITQSREELDQKKSKKENISKKSPKVHAKDFAKYTLERLHQIIDTAVFPHVTKSDIEKKLIMELETRTAKGDSVLHTAVRHQQFELLEGLLECISSHIDDLSPIVNCSNKLNRQSPLHVAVQSSSTDQSRQIVEYLLELGADPNKPDISEFTPLHLAVEMNNLSAAECLLEFPGVNINQVSADLGTALHIAAEKNIPEMALLLIRRGADINSIDLQRGQTPLHVAVKKSNVQIVDLLLKQTDIDINKEDYRCQTPLKFAILRADTRLMKIVNKLINHGANYESINTGEETDDSLESVQEDETKTMESEKMQTLAFLFRQISVTENNDSVNDKSEMPQIEYYIVE